MKRRSVKLQRTVKHNVDGTPAMYKPCGAHLLKAREEVATLLQWLAVETVLGHKFGATLCI